MITEFEYKMKLLELAERKNTNNISDDEFFSEWQALQREYSMSTGSFSSSSFGRDYTSYGGGEALRDRIKKLRKEYKQITEEIKQLEEENLEENQELIEELRRNREEVGNELRKNILESNKHTEVELIGHQIESFGNRISSTVDGIVGSLQRMYRAVNDLIDPWAKVDQAASNYAKTVATSAKGRDILRQQTLTNVVKNKIAASYDLSTPELIEAQMEYSKGIGRNAKLSDEAQVVLGTMNKVYGGAEKELSVMFEKFGVGPIDTGKHLGKMFKEASKSGLSLEKYASNVNQGLRLAQRYTFSGGLKSMEAMAKRATEIHMDMQQIQILADKVGTIEGSITTAAKLQVLGGPFAGLADPMGMFSEAWGNMEGLEKRLEGFTSQMGRFNRTTGEVEISAFNKQRLRAMAEATGMDFQQLIEQTQQQAKLGEIKSQIARSANASQWDKATQELFRNTATFENGKAGVSINGEFKTIDELNSDDLKQLKEETQSESEDIKEIASMLRDYFQVKSSAEKQKEARLARFSEKTHIGPIMKSLTNRVGHTNWILRILNGLLIANIAGSFIGGFGGTFRGIGGVGTKVKQMVGSGTGGAVAQTISGGATTTAAGGGIKGALSRAFGKETITTSSGKIYTKVNGQVFNESGKRITGAAEKAILNSKNSVVKPSFFNRAWTGVKNIGTKIKSPFTKLSSKGVESGVKTVATQEVAKKTSNAALEKVGSVVTKNMAKEGAKAFLKGGAIAGTVGAAGNILTDTAVEKGKIKKGGKGHAAMKVGFSMLEYGGTGAMIGTMLGGPVIGTAIGAGIGAVVGATKIAKVRREMALDNKLSAKGIERQGEYGARRLKKIESGLEGKKISKHLRRKMERDGDIELLAEIDKANEVKQQKKADKREKRRKNRLEFLQAIKPVGGIANKFDKANFEVNIANFGGKAFNKAGKTSDITAFGRLKTKQNGKLKHLLNTQTTALTKVPFGIINGMLGSNKSSLFGFDAAKVGLGLAGVSIKGGKLEDGNSSELQGLRRLDKKIVQETQRVSKIDPIDININGTLKLDGGNGKSLDIIDEIKKDNRLRNAIVEILAPEISKQLRKITFGGNKVVKTGGVDMPTQY